jgi:hypothetical protein
VGISEIGLLVFFMIMCSEGSCLLIMMSEKNEKTRDRCMLGLVRYPSSFEAIVAYYNERNKGSNLKHFR